MINLKKINEYIKIFILIIILAIIGISYTIYYAFTHNGEITYQSYGINQVISVNPTLSFLQILVIILLGLGFVGSIVFIAYSKGGKISPEKILESEEKSIFFALETILLTTILTLVIVIPTNILLEKYNTSNNYKNETQIDGNSINSNINRNYQ